MAPYKRCVFLFKLFGAEKCFFLRLHLIILSCRLHKDHSTEHRCPRLERGAHGLSIVEGPLTDLEATAGPYQFRSYGGEQYDRQGAELLIGAPKSRHLPTWRPLWGPTSFRSNC